MLELDVDDPLEETTTRRKHTANRKLFIIVIVCINVVVLGIVAVILAVVLKDEANNSVSESDKTLEPGPTTSSSSPTTSYILFSTTDSIIISPTPTTQTLIYTSSLESTGWKDLSTLETVSIESSMPEFTQSVSLREDISVTTVSLEISSTVQSTVSTTPVTLPDCKLKEFQCEGGECIPETQVCDHVTQCQDKSDEKFCTNCTGFQCRSGVCLWGNLQWRCDGIFHCSDLSDEINCSLRPGYCYCSNGIQIPRLNWCDGVDNCFDNSDEIACPCVNGRYACPDGSCILRDWLCDGHSDCQNGTDEKNCNSCSSDQFVCSDFTCLNESQVCDGNYTCTGKEDEANCFELSKDTLGGRLLIKYKNKTFPVCADHWSFSHSQFVCDQHDLSLRSDSFIISTDNISEVFALKNGDRFTPDVKPVLQHFHKTTTCPSQRLVYVSCKHQECGERKASVLTPFIAGGNMVSSGQWPWVAAVTYLGKYQCTGTVIGQRWIITAGHCVARTGIYNYTNTPYYFNIILGSTSINDKDSKTKQQLRVSKIITHPDMKLKKSGITDWDIALLQTADSINYTDYVQPICLPHSEETSLTSFLCFVAGWGRLNNQQYVVTGDLRDAKMRIWPDSQCSTNVVAGEADVNTNSTLCAGYLTGVPTACQGDSGGPLMCQRKAGGRWYLMGVVNSGSNECGQWLPSLRANRFTRVAKVVDWIQKVISD